MPCHALGAVAIVSDDNKGKLQYNRLSVLMASAACYSVDLRSE